MNNVKFSFFLPKSKFQVKRPRFDLLCRAVIRTTNDYTNGTIEIAASAMNPAVAPRHSSRSPSLSLSVSAPSPMEPSSAPVPGTPPSATTTLGATVEIESPFYLSPKSPKAELGRTRSQSRRTLGNWQLGKTIGQGSMGRVRLGHSLVTGEQVPTSNPKLSQTYCSELISFCSGCCQDNTSFTSRNPA